jgi:hypothetical protein
LNSSELFSSEFEVLALAFAAPELESQANFEHRTSNTELNDSELFIRQSLIGNG